MTELAILLRALQLTAHNYHNLCAKALFFGDHEMLGEIYGEAETQYDEVIERMIGLDMTPDLTGILVGAVTKVQTQPKIAPENVVYLQTVLAMKKEILMKIEQLVKTPGMTEGTRQLVGDIANATEKSIYKLKQRIKK